MENKLSIKSAVNHSNAFVEKIAKLKYADKEYVRGEELPKLTDIKQVNFLLIYILLQSWKAETQKLKSPYFDYSSDEVKEALENFMNVLSRNISIRRKDFEPLLKKAFQLTLLYFNNPMSFLTEIFKEKVTHKELSELQKLVKSNFVDGILAFLEDEKLDEVVLDELEPSSLEMEDSTEFLDKLAAHLEISEDNNSEEKAPEIVNQFKTSPNLNDKFQKSEKSSTLNEKHESGKKDIKTIADSHSGGKVNRISNQIPLNEQFQITNDVFGGMKSVYNSFIEKLDDANSYADATLLVDEFVSKTEHIESNKYLQNLVGRKFLD